MSALDYYDAAWDALGHEDRPPDPSELSDEALGAVMRFDVRDLPTDARRAAEAEWKRRRPKRNPVDEIVTFVVLALLGASGTFIAWVLFVP